MALFRLLRQVAGLAALQLCNRLIRVPTDAEWNREQVVRLQRRVAELEHEVEQLRTRRQPCGLYHEPITTSAAQVVLTEPEGRGDGEGEAEQTETILLA